MKISWNEPTVVSEANGVKTTESVSHVNDDATIGNVEAILSQYEDYEITVSIKIK